MRRRGPLKPVIEMPIVPSTLLMLKMTLPPKSPITTLVAVKRVWSNLMLKLKLTSSPIVSTLIGTTTVCPRLVLWLTTLTALPASGAFVNSDPDLPLGLPLSGAEFCDGADR